MTVLPFTRKIDGEELEDLVVTGVLQPAQIVYTVVTLRTYVWNYGLKNDLIKEAYDRGWSLVFLEIPVDKHFGRRDFHYHVQGPAWQILLFIEMMGKYYV